MKKFTFLILLWAAFWLHGCSDSDSAIAPNLGSESGTGGSMARFTIAGDKLYIVDRSNLHTYDISQAANPRPGATVSIGFGIETVFPYGDNLFIGAADAMYIFDISKPSQPRQLSRYSHFVACDPVVVQGNYAYVTLRTSGCRPNFNNNTLDVIDVSNPNSPRLVQTYTMSSPYGLGIRGNGLFVCEGAAGLRVFDVSEPTNLVQKSFLTTIKTYDVIPLPKSLLVVGEDGFYQYDYSNLAALKLLSKIEVARD